MSVEENKQAFKRSDDEIWINGKHDLIDETMADTIESGGETYTREQWKNAVIELSSQPGKQTVRVDYHQMVGEGEKLMVWQTNHMADGSTLSGVTYVEYEKGREIRHEWLQISQSG